MNLKKELKEWLFACLRVLPVLIWLLIPFVWIYKKYKLKVDGK